MTDMPSPRIGAKVPFWNNPKSRAAAIQIGVVAGLFLLILEIGRNTLSNLSRMNQEFSFSFLSKSAGFDIIQSMVPYSSDASYGRALMVGLFNTVLISALCIVAATILGFLIGIMRLSRNRLAAGVATIYIEFFRNIPVLLQIFVWYSLIILQILPVPRGAFNPFGLFFLSNRGLVLPRPVFGEGASLGLWGLALAVVAVVVLARWARRRRDRTGQPVPVVRISAALLVGLPLAGLAVAGFPVAIDIPTRTAFSFSGGLFVLPELMALFLALSIYYATYIAEAVRAGIQSVSHGQTEAAHALGIAPGQTMWRVVIPQAMRVVIPPLVSIYLGITKTSSLAVAIGYPDLVAVGGTILNQTGKAIEIVSIWMIVYLSLSLATSLFMNWFNTRMKLVER